MIPHNIGLHLIMMTGLNGTALITGAGSGIGAATAHKFAANGISALGLLDINLSNLENVLHEILNATDEGSRDFQIFILRVDVTDETAVANAVQKVVKRFGRIDIAVHAAGVGDVGLATHEVPVSDWRRIIEIDQIGTWLCHRAAIQQMLKQESRGLRHGRGVIVNVASALGLTATTTGMPCPSYITAKHAVLGFTKMDAKFYAAQEIRINAICPGWTNTPMIPAVNDAGAMARDMLSAPIGRVGEVEEIADAILFLASPMSSFVYGVGLLVDGGYAL